MLTQLVSAVCFLEDVDASVLTIAHGEFERGLRGFQETARVGLQAHQQKVTSFLVGDVSDPFASVFKVIWMN